MSGTEKIMKKILYTILGAIAGGVVGVAANYLLISWACDIVNCFFETGVSADASFVICMTICMLIGAISGFTIGNSDDKEDSKKLEGTILNQTRNLLTQIEYDDYAGECETAYTEIWKMKNQIYSDKTWKTKSVGISCGQQFEELMQNHIEVLNQSVRKNLEDWLKFDHYNGINDRIFNQIYKKLQLLKYAKNGNRNYDNAIYAVKNYLESYQKIKNRSFYFVKQLKYGDFMFPFDNPENMDYMDHHIFEILKNKDNIFQNLSDNSDGYYCGIAKNLTIEIYDILAKVMWYYAKKEPFDANHFNHAYEDYEKYVTDNCGNVEMELAKIYSKSKMGGLELIKQEKNWIEKWVEFHLTSSEALASGLSWLELYEIERDVLRLMVKNNQQLTPEAQDRLRFLENSDAMNVKVYDIAPTSEFMFDTSSEKWNESEFEVFFRKVGMKKMSLNYSLAISSWKKTLPLISGQRFDQSLVFLEFEKVMQSFNNEVTCKKMTVRAVDLDNVVYENSAVFSFTSERNKCLTMVFFCDVFGPTLNITILTLFTPEKGMNVESMQKYAKAIKSNIYVDSFKEIILQAVDEVLKEKKDIYADNTPQTSIPGRFVE